MARHEQLADLIENANTTFHGDRLRAGTARVPVSNSSLSHCARATRTFAERPSTFDALEEPGRGVQAHQQAAHAAVLEAASAARHRHAGLCTTSACRSAAPAPTTTSPISPCPLPELAKTLSSAAPASVTALQESVPITAFLRALCPRSRRAPCAPSDRPAPTTTPTATTLRVTPILPDFALGSNNTLTPTTPTQALENLNIGSADPLPGRGHQPAADGSSPFTDGEQPTCDPSETP